MVAKICGIISHVLEMQYNLLCIHSVIGAQAAKAWKVSGCARRNPAMHHFAFWRDLHGSKTQRIPCEGKEQCHALDHRVHSCLSSLALCCARCTLQMKLRRMGGMYIVRSITQMPNKVPALIMDVLGLDLSSFIPKLWVQELEWCWAMWRSIGEMSQAKDAPAQKEWQEGKEKKNKPPPMLASCNADLIHLLTKKSCSCFTTTCRYMKCTTGLLPSAWVTVFFYAPYDILILSLGVQGSWGLSKFSGLFRTSRKMYERIFPC